jgi:hypothetical protein
MFIIWGKKVVYRKLGYAADFCTVCRCPRPFEIKRVGMAGHVYYISMGEGELVGFERTCQECGTPYKAEPTTYKSLAQEPIAIESLISATFPNLAEIWSERIAIEQKVSRAPASLTSDERVALIREPFLRLSSKVEARFAATHFDKEVGFAFLGAIALMFISTAIARALIPNQAEPVLLTSIALGVLMVIWQLIGTGKRFMLREILPALATALKPLRPVEFELQAALNELKTHGHKIGSKLQASEVMSFIKTGSPRGAKP